MESSSNSDTDESDRDIPRQGNLLFFIFRLAQIIAVCIIVQHGISLLMNILMNWSRMQNINAFRVTGKQIKHLTPFFKRIKRLKFSYTYMEKYHTIYQKITILR